MSQRRDSVTRKIIYNDDHNTFPTNIHKINFHEAQNKKKTIHMRKSS